MNEFNNLPSSDDGGAEDIETENQLRAAKKKVRRLNEKQTLTNEQSSKLRILEIMIKEHENKNKEEKNKSKKKTKKEKRDDSDDNFLDQEYQKNKDYWRKEEERKRKEDERKERKRKEDERRRKEEKKRHEKERKRKENITNEEAFFSDYDVKIIPEDILDLYKNYDGHKYRQMSLKYHPDKSNYAVDYQKIINEIKCKFS